MFFLNTPWFFGKHSSNFYYMNNMLIIQNINDNFVDSFARNSSSFESNAMLSYTVDKQEASTIVKNLRTKRVVEMTGVT